MNFQTRPLSENFGAKILDVDSAQIVRNMFLRLITILIAMLLFALVFTPNTSMAQSSKRVGVKGFKPVADTEKMKRWGIIIGINTYDDPNINSLRYASADASAIYDVLTHPQTGGFKKEQLHLLTSNSANPPTRNNILESLALLNRMIRTGDTVVFHFSGHGLTQNGINYLLPADARVNIPTETAIPLSRVYAAIQNAKRQIIFLDACHSGQRRDKGTTSGAMSSAFAEAVFSEAEGRVTLASCNINESSFEDDKLGHGVFTYYLLEALRGKADTLADKRVTASEANRYVVEKVKAWAFANRKRQNPRISSNVSGEIVLMTATLSVPRVPPTPPVDPGSTPIVGTFDQTVAQIKSLEAELEQNRQRIRERVEGNRQRGEQEIAKFRESHKLNAPKDMFESDADYAERISQLDALVAKRQEELRKRHLEDAQRALGDIQTRIARLSQIARLYRRIFPTNDVTVTLGTYDANNQFFPITFEAKSLRLESRLNLEKDNARNLYYNWDKVVKTGYLSIDPGYRRALAMVKLEYPPVWQQGVTYTFNEVYHLGDNNDAIAFSPDGQYFATGTNRNVFIGKVSSGEKIWQTTFGGLGKCIAFSPVGQYLATGDNSNVTLWSVSSGTQIWQESESACAVSFSPGGQYLATAYPSPRRYGNVALATLWNASSGEKIWQESERADAVSFSPDGKYLATGGEAKVSIWEVNSGSKVREIKHKGTVYAVTFSPDGQYLAAGGRDRAITFYRIPTDITIEIKITKESVIQASSTISNLAWSPYGNLISDGKKVYHTLLQPEEVLAVR